MIESVYYELCLDLKYNPQNFTLGKLNQMKSIAAQYFNKNNVFSIRELKEKTMTRIEHKILNKTLSNEQRRNCFAAFSDKEIMRNVILNKQSVKDEKDYFVRLSKEDQNRLLLYMYLCKNNPKSKLAFKYLRYFIKNEIDIHWVPGVYCRMNLDEVKKILINKGISSDLLEEKKW